MFLKLDRFDWYYAKKDIWSMFGFTSILWPIVLFKFDILINPKKIFENGMASARRMEYELYENPPPSGNLIRYKQKNNRWGTETYGEFTFNRSDVFTELRTRLNKTPHLQDKHEGAIFNWVMRHADDSIEISDLPEAWDRFRFVADELIHKKHYVNCICSMCDKELSDDEIIHNDDNNSKKGWNSNKLFCKNGHLLLEVETMHIHMG